MPNTYHQIYIQTVFPVKYRAAVIEKSWKNQLYALIGNLIKEKSCKTIIVNGVEDHVHCFFGLKPSVSVSEVMKNAKAKSSKWLNESGLLRHHFECQEGFGAFSYSHSHIEDVFKYIKNQEEHHNKQSLREEYLDLLKQHAIDYDERYILQDLI